MGVTNAMCDGAKEDAPHSDELKEAFWPRTRQAGDFMTDLMQDGRSREEFETKDPYIGILEGKPPRAYNVATDLREGFYVFVNPAPIAEEPVWLGRAVENPQFDPKAEHFREVLVQWYIPCRTSKDVQQLYAGWDSKSSFRWKIDKKAHTSDYVSTDSVMASWKPKKNDGASFIAPRQQVKFAVDNLRRIAEEEQRLLSMNCPKTTST